MHLWTHSDFDSIHKPEVTSTQNKPKHREHMWTWSPILSQGASYGHLVGARRKKAVFFFFCLNIIFIENTIIFIQDILIPIPLSHLFPEPFLSTITTPHFLHLIRKQTHRQMRIKQNEQTSKQQETTNTRNTSTHIFFKSVATCRW